MNNGCKLSEQIEHLSRDLQRVRDELAEAQRSAEKEELQSVVASLTAERDQLKMDLQENVEMVSLCVFYQTNHDYSFWSEFTNVCGITQMIENQGELMSALQMNREQKELIKQLEKEQTSGQDGSPRDDNEQLLTQVSY